jgi:carboxylate-amine ligase
MTCALHVHVGMPSGDVAVEVMAKLKPYLPILIALSASSPFWQGHDTGHVSYRQRILSSMRTYGMPPTFQSWQAFTDFFIAAKQAQMFEIFQDIHWDLRPRPDLGTLEIRAMDAQPTLQESLLLSAFVHSLVNHLQTCHRDQATCFQLHRLHWLLEKENYFQAARLGLNARYIKDDQGNSRPICLIAEDILDTLIDQTVEFAESYYLKLLKERLQSGSSYRRQRKIFQETGSLKLVTAALAKELAEDKIFISTSRKPRDDELQADSSLGDRHLLPRHK